MAMDQATGLDMPSKRVYVGNLPYHAQAVDIETYLVEAGFEIEKLDLSVDPFTGKNPSYCFVELTNHEQAQRALNELPGASFMGRPLKVNVHIPKRRDGAPSTTRTFSGTGNGEQASPATPARTFGNDWRTPSSRTQEPREGGGSAFSNRWNSRTESPAHSQSTPSQGGRRVYVGNLPEFDSQEDLEAQLGAVFGAFTVESVSKLITGNPREDDTTGLHHYCFVDLADANEALKAIAALDGSVMSWGGSLRVNVAKDRRQQTEGYAPRRVDSPSAAGGERAAASPAVERPVRDLGSLSSWRRGN